MFVRIPENVDGSVVKYLQARWRIRRKTTTYVGASGSFRIFNSATGSVQDRNMSDSFSTNRSYQRSPLADSSSYHNLRCISLVRLLISLSTRHSVDVMDVQKEVLTFILLHKRVYKKNRFCNKFLAQCRPRVGLLLVYCCKKTTWSYNWLAAVLFQLQIIPCRINQELADSTFLEKSELMTQYNNFPLTAARDTAACGNDTTVHNASHIATRRGAAAGNRWSPRLGSFSSDSSAADTAAYSCGNAFFWTIASLAALHAALLVKTARGKGALDCMIIHI